MGAAGSFVAMNNRISQSVPHLHTHVVPRNPKDGLRGFFWPRGKYADDAEAAAVAARLRTCGQLGQGSKRTDGAAAGHRDRGRHAQQVERVARQVLPSAASPPRPWPPRR